MLRSLHGSGVLVLPNAWDAGSAAAIAAAGAKAIATTSGGAAWSLGHADGHGLTRELMAEQAARIAGAVAVPVTADIEGGYGPTPEDVARPLRRSSRPMRWGVDLEDSGVPAGGLFDAPAQAARLRRAGWRPSAPACPAW